MLKRFWKVALHHQLGACEFFDSVGAGLILIRRAVAGMTMEDKGFSDWSKGVPRPTPDQFETGVPSPIWSVFDWHQQTFKSHHVLRGFDDAVDRYIYDPDIFLGSTETNLVRVRLA
jgi:hypothetical protein